jgi:glutamate-5-semialdehyde dehydrogenase
MKKNKHIRESMVALAKKAKRVSHDLANLSSVLKNQALIEMADRLEEKQEWLIEENQKDLRAGEMAKLSLPMTDRLRLTPKVVQGMTEGLREVAHLSDPVGEVVKMWKRPNGLKVGKMRIPLGVIGIIYESRPNVTSDAAGLCLKSGNSVILRGGSEAFHSNQAIGKILQASLTKVGIPEEAIQVVPFPEREAILEMLQLEDEIDLIIPRGGEELIRFVTSYSKIPVLKHYKGVWRLSQNVGMELAILYYIESVERRQGRVVQRI